VKTPARGRDGGADGAAGIVRLASGGLLKAKGLQRIPRGDRLILDLPGGGGLGDPSTRPIAQLDDDVADGLVSAGAAKALYGKPTAF
jgi:N-methylhydantoinase B